ncbi:unnamed protein product [marine sediment metagenome]|uniref:Uncharacterized protein n=1 Tax=marine sediment metagenome TaxID=412755 RepID=X1LUY7_9ZZZZ
MKGLVSKVDPTELTLNDKLVYINRAKNDVPYYHWVVTLSRYHHLG